jgi:EAL domain-containing protein (putative c-di-GMP-specific phosphodiesterase class I)
MSQENIPIEEGVSTAAQAFSILERNSAISFFEPVFSVHKMGVVGLESVGRAIDPSNQQLIEPFELFRGMGEEDFYIKLGLDRLFRQKGLESFVPFRARTPRLLCFLDIEPSVLEENIVGSGHFHKQVLKTGCDPQQVVVQLPLTGKINVPLVSKFIQFQRERHFLVGLKEMNSTPGKLEAMLRFNPDLIQLEDACSEGLARNREKQELFFKTTRKAHEMGIVVMAGGLDNEEDALAALEMGADLLQGSYFSHNRRSSLLMTLNRKARMTFLSARYLRRMAQRAYRDRDLRKRCEKMASWVFTRIESAPAIYPPSLFPNLSLDYPALECLYMLDEEGTQISATACNEVLVPERKRFLFQTTPIGTDHSFMEYFYGLDNSNKVMVTEPRLSMNSGHLCVTASKLIVNSKGDNRVVCLDLNLGKI